MRLRRQLPVHSPLPFGAIAAASAEALDPRKDPVQRLSHLLLQRYNAEEVQLFGSGTQALTAAIETALELVGREAPVALPGYACYDLATAAVGADATVLLYDLDPATVAPDLESVERTLEQGARVVVVAPLYGIPVDWDAAEILTERYGAVLIEDAAQGSGASWKGRPLGSLGPLSVLSFGRGKGWTGAGGGALLARSGTTLRRHRPADPGPTASLKSFASALAQWLMARPSIYGIPRGLPWLRLGETHYHEPGSFRSISRFSAALALATDSPSLGEAEARRNNAVTLRAAMAEGGCEPVPVRAASGDAVPGCLRLPILAPADQRVGLLEQLGPLGGESGYPAPLVDLAPIRARLHAHQPDELPGARTLAAELLTLPPHSLLSSYDLERLAQISRLRSDPTP